MADAGSVRRRDLLKTPHASFSNGIVLRSGSANLSASGLNKQDNDLIIVPDPEAVGAFEARFESIWTSAVP